MIKISRQVDYALQLIFALHKAKMSGPLSLKKFSTESTISFLFMQKIARELRSAGLIHSRKGKLGGYTLVKDLDALSLLEVVQAVDGPLGVTACSRGADCEREMHCLMKQGMEKINHQLVLYLQNQKVSELVSA